MFLLEKISFEKANCRLRLSSQQANKSECDTRVWQQNGQQYRRMKSIVYLNFPQQRILIRTLNHVGLFVGEHVN